MKTLYALLLMPLLLSNPAVAEEIENDIHASDSLVDTIKLKLSPKSYWEKMIKGLEWSMKFGRGEIRDLILEHKKLLATKDIELAQAANFARSIGASTKEALQERWAELKEERDALRELIREERAILKRDKMWLEQARRELEKSK